MTEDELQEIYRKLNYIADVVDDINGRINDIENWIDHQRVKRESVETNM